MRKRLERMMKKIRLSHKYFLKMQLQVNKQVNIHLKIDLLINKYIY